MCGEKNVETLLDACMSGSPPHVRGKEVTKYVCKPQGGITPACAGKSSSLRKRKSTAQDHPRVCGEKPLQLQTNGST